MLRCVPRGFYRYGKLLAHNATRAQIRCAVGRGRLIRLARGVYAGQQPRVGDELWALFARLPPGAMLTRQSAAHLLGFAAAPRGDVQVLVPAGIARPRIGGVTCYEAVLAVPEPAWVGGVPCTPSARTAIDLARTRSRLDAIALLDRALHTGACDGPALDREVA